MINKPSYNQVSCEDLVLVKRIKPLLSDVRMIFAAKLCSPDVLKTDNPIARLVNVMLRFQIGAERSISDRVLIVGSNLVHHRPNPTIEPIID